MTFRGSDIGGTADFRAAEMPGLFARAPSLAWPRILFFIFLAGVLLRVFLTDRILNGFWPYTTDGGLFPGKIHPGSYLAFMACGLLYLSPGMKFRDADIPVVRAVILFAVASSAAALVPLLQGRNGPVGYVLDVYLSASAACLFLLAMPPAWRQYAGLTVLVALGINALLAMGEFASGRYILPSEAAEFRPTALLGAALNAGVINLTACVLLIALPIHWTVKFSLISALMIGLLISASRTAMLVSLVALPVAMLVTAHLRRKGYSTGATLALMVMFGVVAAPLLLFTVAEFGFLDRFKSGYVDDSAQTRIDIYRVFEFVTWREIVMGTDILLIRRIAKELLNIELIESALVFFVFDFGLPGAIVFAACLLWLLFSLARGAHPVIGLALLIFLGLALTNNTLSTKVPTTFAALMLAVALRGFDSRARR